jgi:hypothetical protein
LVEILLPEALAMVRAAEIGIGEFGNVLPVLDAMTPEGRELGDPVLLGALLLPHLLLKRYERESRRQGWVDAAEFRDLASDTLESFRERFVVPNLTRVLMIQAFEGFHRLCEGDFTRGQRKRFASKSYFDDALALFEILVRATGEGGEELAEWQEARRGRKRCEPRVEVRRGRPRRRRRR